MTEAQDSARSIEAESGDSAKSGRHHEISRERDEGWVGRLCAVEPQGPAAVRFRHLAVRLRSMMDQRQDRSVLVTSALPGEGKTTVSVNLALALASIAPEYRVALVDMDLRRGRVGKALGFEGALGLESYLAGEVELDQVRVTTDMPSLDFFPTAQPQADAHRLLGGAAQDLFAELNRQYDYVVIDGPPVLPVPDIPLLAPYVGGCLAVVASGRTRDRAFRDCLELLPRSSILGVFLNESRSAGKSSRYGYYAAAEAMIEEPGETHS